MQTRALITGGLGFVAANLLDHALQHTDWEFVLLDNGQNSVPDNIRAILSRHKDSDARRIVEILEGDVRDPGICKRACKNVNVIFNLAAETGVVESLTDPLKVYETNVGGTLNLLQAGFANGVRGFIFASSNAAVGEAAGPVHENLLPKPISPYGASKLAAEAFCMSQDHCFSIGVSCLRFSNVYGPFCQRKSSVVARFLREVMGGKGVTIYGTGQQTRDLLFVADVAAAACRVAQLLMQPPGNGAGIGGQIFQVGTGCETSILDLVSLIREITGTDFPVIHEEERPGEILRSVSDCSKIRQLVGWSANTSLRDGIELTWKWMQQAD